MKIPRNHQKNRNEKLVGHDSKENVLFETMELSLTEGSSKGGFYNEQI